MFWIDEFGSGFDKTYLKIMIWFSFSQACCVTQIETIYKQNWYQVKITTTTILIPTLFNNK